MERGAKNLRPGTESLGRAVHVRRRALGLTQQELADLAGVGVRLVHEVEHDADTVQLAKLVGLLGALGLHLKLAPGTADSVQAGDV